MKIVRVVVCLVSISLSGMEEEHLHVEIIAYGEKVLCHDGNHVHLDGTDLEGRVIDLARYLARNYFWRVHNQVLAPLSAQQVHRLILQEFVSDGCKTTLLQELHRKSPQGREFLIKHAQLAVMKLSS